MDLSEPVAAAVDEAVRIVLDMVAAAGQDPARRPDDAALRQLTVTDER